MWNYGHFLFHPFELFGKSPVPEYIGKRLAENCLVVAGTFTFFDCTASFRPALPAMIPVKPSYPRVCDTCAPPADSLDKSVKVRPGNPITRIEIVITCSLSRHRQQQTRSNIIRDIERGGGGGCKNKLEPSANSQRSNPVQNLFKTAHLFPK